ncbi:MAG: hypothetical protein ACAH95_13635 [Fimbriimonas sp.]
MLLTLCFALAQSTTEAEIVDARIIDRRVTLTLKQGTQTFETQLAGFLADTQNRPTHEPLAKFLQTTMRHRHAFIDQTAETGESSVSVVIFGPLKPRLGVTISRSYVTDLTTLLAGKGYGRRVPPNNGHLRSPGM